MSRVLLISSNTTTDPMPVYPLGMALVASSLIEDGHVVKQLDPLTQLENMFSLVTDTINTFHPDVIGISIRNIDTVDSLASPDTWYLGSIKELVKHIRNCSQKPLVLGGPGFSIMPEQILSFLQADFGIAGEGEILIKQLIQDIANHVKIPKIRYSTQNQMDTDAFYTPCYEPELVTHYVDHSGMLNYQTKRGCPYGCHYCSYPIIEGRKFRYQEPGFVVENLLILKEKFQVDRVFFTDSVFNDPKGRYIKIAELMIKNKCHMKWAGYFRPEKISQDKLSLLKRSGLYAMEIGSDAACDKMLDGMNKTFNFDTILGMNEACRKAEIPCAHFFIFGGPGETRMTVHEGIKNIQQLKKCAVFIFSGIRIIPRTGIHKIAVQQGMISADDTLLKPRYYVSPSIDKEWMDNELKSVFKKQKDRFFPPEEGHMRMKALKVFGFKGLLWDMAIQIQTSRKR